MAEVSVPPERPNARDAEATKQRLLAAAISEFAEHGLAGARVDRIAEAAGGSKQLIYRYFGNKEALFEAAISHHIDRLTETVPLTPDDLGAYAAAMYDYMLANPKTLSLLGWRNFERPEPTDTELRSYRAKIKALATAQQDGRLNDAFTPPDLLAMILGLVTSWISASPALRVASGRTPMSARRLAEHREALIHAARQLSQPAT